MIVAAYDPGVTTGYAVADVRDRLSDPHIIALGALEDINAVRHAVSVLEPSYDVRVRIVEDFIGGGSRTREAIHTLKLVGFLELADNGTTLTIESHVPQWRKAFVTEAQALAEAQGFRSAGRHGVDALSHILYYNFRQKLKE